MSTITKECEVELSTGRTVAVSLEVEGIYDSHYGADADGNRGQGRWMVDSHSYEVETEDELSEEETAELDEKVEELVYEGDWDFDTAHNERDDDSEEDFF